MAECDKEIKVRTITGESFVASISGDKTVDDLKLLLKQIFPPATNSPSFHLFFKGRKLRPQSLINSHCIEHDEFLVFVPFTKKESPQIQVSDEPKTSVVVSDRSSITKFADMFWSEMVEDLSYFDYGSNKNLSDSECSNVGDKRDMPASTSSSCCFVDKSKRKRSFKFDKLNGSLGDHVMNILRSPIEGVFNENTQEKFVMYLENENCLSNPLDRKCKLLRKAKLLGLSVPLDGTASNSCICPGWLKLKMKAFAFLNIFSAFLQLRQEHTTLSRLEEALQQLKLAGVNLSNEDIKDLSLLCPKVVLLVSSNMEEMYSDDKLVIFDHLPTPKYPVEDTTNAGKQMTSSNIISAWDRRERYFKTNLLEAVDFLCKNNNELAAPFCLRDLIKSAKESGADVCKNEGKRPRRSDSNSHLGPTCCHDREKLLPEEMVEHLRKGAGSDGQIVHIEDISARGAIHVEIPNELSVDLRSALKCIGIANLYCHQADSIQASLFGKNVAVATMTSSGKSLCYNLPVLEVMSQNSLSCAFYLFPTKALAQDQLRALLVMQEGFGAAINVGVYDGDTSCDQRSWLRDNARILITNPDMLHISILPYHRQFSRILSNLRFMVIDEAHTYNGAFGCHTSLILRRLRRLCSHVYGSDPSFIFCSATSANPREHCMELANISNLELIQNDGSPSARKLFILWNPIMASKKAHEHVTAVKSKENNFQQTSTSPILDVSRLLAEMVQHGLRCIAFCKTRKLCELVLSYTCKILQETAPSMVQSVCAYRGGYTAEDRRKIERDFFGGKLCGIAATNALELGIDVGNIDVTLHLGFPGSIASLWQQAGRAGRREKTSLAVYVAFEGPLDQYFMKHPKKLFGSPNECCHISSQNQQVLEQHLTCAAFEHPLSLIHDEQYFGSGLQTAIMSLKNEGYLNSSPPCDSYDSIWNYIGHEKNPSHLVSIRAIESERYKVVDQQRNKVLEEIEESKAFFQVYEGAVYMNQGKTYLVKSLDLSSKIASCDEADTKYYTKTRDYTDIHVIGGNMAYPRRVSNIQLSKTTAQADDCVVTTTWFGFYRVWKGSNKIFDSVDLSLPKYSYESKAVWIPVPQSIKEVVKRKNVDFRAGLHAASHALLNVVPLRVMCNLSDLAAECANPNDTRYFPERILLYDQRPGGTGISVQVQPVFIGLLASALELLTTCRCLGDAGCPYCIQSLACREYNEVLHKDAAILIIKGVLDAEKAFFEGDCSLEKM